MSGEDLERRNHLGERNGFVRLPLLVVLNAVDHHDEVLVGALVVELGVCGVSASHCEFVVVIVFVKKGWVYGG